MAERHPYKMACAPPVRVWYPTENGWASRDWLPGEKDQYAREVLGWKSATNPGADD